MYIIIYLLTGLALAYACTSKPGIARGSIILFWPIGIIPLLIMAFTYFYAGQSEGLWIKFFEKKE